MWTKPQTTLEICLQKMPTLVDKTLKSPLKKFSSWILFMYGSASPGCYYSKAHCWNITKELRIRAGKLKALSKSQYWPAGPWLDPPDILAMKLFFFPKGFAEKPFPLCIMFSISLIWVITFWLKWNSNYGVNRLADQFWQIESALRTSIEADCVKYIQVAFIEKVL